MDCACWGCGAVLALCVPAGRIAALTGQADALLGRLFWLLARLREPESSVRLLQAVSVVVEVQCSFVPMPIPTSVLPATCWSLLMPIQEHLELGSANKACNGNLLADCMMSEAT